MAKLEAILSDPDAEVGHQLSACRLLVSEDLAAVIRSMEHGHDEDARRQERIQTAVGLVLEHHPEVVPDQAERYVKQCLEAMEPTNLTEILKDRLGFWKSEPLTDETLGQIWVELGLPGNPGPEPEPPPKCGFKELPTPASGPAPSGALPADADCAYLAQRAVEDERRRRERIKHPGQVPAAAPPPPTPAPEPEPEPEPTPAPEPDRPFLDFGGFCFTPDLGG